MLRAAVSRSRDDSGQITPFAVILTLAVLLMAGLVLDGGNALSAKTRALDIAQAAARAGAQQLDLTAYRTTTTIRLDPAKATTAARAWLAAAGAEGTATATTATVTVTVASTTDTQLLNLAGIRELHVTATATATAVHGVTGPGT
jgi:Flp pilus assembly protein TadG